LRVLQVVTSTQRRGAETYAADLGGALANRVRSLRTVALAAGGGGASLPFEVVAPGSSARSPAALRGLRRRARSVDVVVAHGSATLPVCALGTAVTGPPFVYRLIGEPRYWTAGRARRLRVRAFLRRAAAVVVYYPQARADLLARYDLAPDRVVVLPKGAPVGVVGPVTEAERAAARRALGLADTPVVAYIGALRDEKLPEVAVRAAAAVPEATLVVAGDGPQRALLAATASASGLDARFLGAVDDVRAVLAACDVVPGALLEAAMAGRPAVASDVGGVREIVEPGRTGELVPVGDVAATAAALVEVLVDAEGRGRAARARAETFDLDAVAQRWATLLADVVARADRG
jgi:glycosyltransferase involved in cell wall biosynthesis